MASKLNIGENHRMPASIHLFPPNNDRMVILQNAVNGMVETVGARYRDGRWFGEASGSDLTKGLNSTAIWFESVIFLPSCLGAKDRESASVKDLQEQITLQQQELFDPMAW